MKKILPAIIALFIVSASCVPPHRPPLPPKPPKPPHPPRPHAMMVAPPQQQNEIKEVTAAPVMAR